MNWSRYGPNALLFRFADKIGDESFATNSAITKELERNPPEGMVEFVPAFTTVLIVFDDRERVLRIADPLRRRLERCATSKVVPTPAKEIPVTYHGPDLNRVAELHNLTTEEVAEIHAATTYKVYMLGFSPG